MIPENRIPTHPGEVLLAEFLEAWGLSQAEFARQVGIPLQRVNEIVKGKRGVTPETAWILAQAFGTTPEFWMNLQVLHDLAKAKPSKKTPRVTRVARSHPDPALAGGAPNQAISQRPKLRVTLSNSTPTITTVRASA